LAFYINVEVINNDAVSSLNSEINYSYFLLCPIVSNVVINKRIIAMINIQKVFNLLFF